MSDNHTFLQNMITNISEAIIRQLGIVDESIINETHNVVRERLHACPLFYLNHVGYKNLLEISLEFDAFLNDCLNDVILRLP